MLRYCGANAPPTLRKQKRLLVLFESDKKRSGSGAQCRVKCEGYDQVSLTEHRVNERNLNDNQRKALSTALGKHLLTLTISN